MALIWTGKRGDGLASVKQVVDSSQAIENSYSYEAFGQPTVGQSDVANPYLFVGGYGVQWESTPSLYFMQARYYGPGVGRFLSEDPYGGAPQDPLSLHRYLYCANGPVSRGDPAGLTWLGGEFPWLHPGDRIEPTRDPSAFEDDPTGRLREYWHDYCFQQALLVGCACMAATSPTLEGILLTCYKLQGLPQVYATCLKVFALSELAKNGVCIYGAVQVYRDCMHTHNQW